MFTPRERRSFNIIENGMTKTDRTVDLLARMPVFGDITNNDIPNPVIKNFAWTRTTRLEDASTDTMNIQVINTNTSGLRGVLPCKGAVSVGMVPSGTGSVLRRPPTNQMDAFYPTPIPGLRHMEKGLLQQEYYCDARPILVPADSFNAGLHSRLGVPA